MDDALANLTLIYLNPPRWIIHIHFSMQLGGNESSIQIGYHNKTKQKTF